jgi:hypothetical protein
MLRRDGHCDLHIISHACKIGVGTLGRLGDFEPPLVKSQVTIFVKVNYFCPSQTYPLDTTTNISTHQ